ncbi:hypothetical protein ACH47Z_18240 [Streptomyces sp. NPDC020192]|uniref:hypothetical protein n=1 Tax=Streptomyces sp. NPDC020192 TaxID=3365066 RepID=UPI0037A38110
MESQILRPGHLTAHQTAEVLGITLEGVRQLVRRRQLKRSSGSPRQPWYAVADVTGLATKQAASKAA